jgi:hypothetical protein
VIEGGGKKYTIKERMGGQIVNVEEGGKVEQKLEGYTVRDSTEFKFKIRKENGDSGPLKERPGCDAIGYYRTSGNIDGTKITMTLEYDIDNDAETKEPKLVLVGDWGMSVLEEGATDAQKTAASNQIIGTWSNENASDPEAAAKMASLGLDGVQEGTFTLSKRMREDDM